MSSSLQGIQFAGLLWQHTEQLSITVKLSNVNTLWTTCFKALKKCSAVPCSSLQEAETLVFLCNRQEWFKCVILHTSPLLPLGPTSPWFRRNEKEETFMIKSEINLLLNTQTGSIFTAATGWKALQSHRQGSPPSDSRALRVCRLRLCLHCKS